MRRRNGSGKKNPNNNTTPVPAHQQNATPPRTRQIGLQGVQDGGQAGLEALHAGQLVQATLVLGLQVLQRHADHAHRQVQGDIGRGLVQEGIGGGADTSTAAAQATG
jgi:hypothetical protein